MPSQSQETTFLLLTPLLSQTAILAVAILESFSVQPFLYASPPIPSTAIKAWCSQYVWRGLGAVLSFGVISVTTGGVAAWKVGGWNGGGLGRDGGKWYVLGALASGSYFILFGAWAGQILDRLLKDRRLPQSPSLLEPTWGVQFRRPPASPDEPESEISALEKEERTKDELRRWLRMHYVRNLVAALPSWLFFVWAVLEALSK